MNQMTRRALSAAAFALLFVASMSFAQQPPQVRVRGTVEAVDGSMLTVKSRDGQTTYHIKLADNAAVRGIIKASLTDIKDNSFIGVTGMPQADNSQKAVEIHIFPDALRGGSVDRPFGLPRYVGAHGDADPAIRQSCNDRTPAGLQEPASCRGTDAVERAPLREGHHAELVEVAVGGGVGSPALFGPALGFASTH